jgi:5-methylcytosine-specific restriction enzyme subunit McrC
MWRIFEDFVTVALTDALRPYGGRSQPQDMCHHLDHARRVQLRPDLVHYQLTPEGRERAAAVVDAKYKIERGPGGFNPDLYQMLAYCTVLGLDRGHLVYAEGPAQPRVHRVHGTGLAIVTHSLDLSLLPDALLAQIEALVADITSSEVAPAGTPV